MKFHCEVPQVLDQVEMEGIYRSALKILAEVPLTADGTEEFNQALLDFGCRLDGRKVFFTRPVINRLLDRIAVYRKEQDAMPGPAPADRITPYISGQGSLIVDTQTDRLRPAVTADLVDLARFIDALGSDVGWCHPTFIPTDHPVQTREIHAFATICLHHHRPSRVSPYSPGALRYMVAILKTCLGSMDKVRENAGLVAHKLWINTPFLLGRESIEGAMLSRQLLGHKIGITMMPVAGAATPITAPGCLALVTAESLAANILSLALDEELCFISSPLTMDLRIGVHVEQDPYTDLLRIGANQMRVFIFGGRPEFSAFAPRTSAKVPGEQAMMEKTLGAMWHLMCGGRGFNSVGTLCSGEVGSLVQILLDLELTGYLNRVLAGLNCRDDERLAEDVNLEVIGQGARFMEQEHTLKYFRQEQWYPWFLDRRVAQAWRQEPRTMLENARVRALELVQTAPNRCPLSEDQKRQIQEILTEADSELANTKGGLA